MVIMNVVTNKRSLVAKRNGSVYMFDYFARSGPHPSCVRLTKMVCRLVTRNVDIVP